MEPFAVKQYSENERPVVKGNGFDGLVLGANKDEAQKFIDFINSVIAKKQPEVLNTTERRYVGQVGAYHVWEQLDTPTGLKKSYGVSKDPSIPASCNYTLLSSLLRLKGL